MLADGGVEVDTQGDAFFFAFPTAPGALAAAPASRSASRSGPIRSASGCTRVRRSSPRRATWAVTSTAPRASPRAGHGGQVLVSASTAPLVELELDDLGEHRLKDLSAPERIYQLGDGDFPALKSSTARICPSRRRRSWVASRSSPTWSSSSDETRVCSPSRARWHGEDPARAAGRRRGGRALPGRRLVGPALAASRSRRSCSTTAAQARRLKERPRRAHLRQVDALPLRQLRAGRGGGAELASLLASCPNLDFLVTSRERLRLSGEHLSGTAASRGRRRGALQRPRPRARSLLRLERGGRRALPAPRPASARARARRRPHGALQPRAAARAALARLDLLKGGRDADLASRRSARRSSGRMTCSPRKSSDLFARLSVFPGGCSYEAAEQVAGAEPDTLQSLLDKSLLRSANQRRGLATGCSRRSASTRPSGSRTVGRSRRVRAAARRVVPRARQGDAEPHLPGSHEGVARLGSSASTTTSGRRSTAWRLTETARASPSRLRNALALLDDTRPQAEARRRLESLLALDTSPTVARGHALNAVAGMAVENGEYETRAATMQERALAIPPRARRMRGVSLVRPTCSVTPRSSQAFLTLRGDGETSWPSSGHPDYVGMATSQPIRWALDELGERERGGGRFLTRRSRTSSVHARIGS